MYRSFHVPSTTTTTTTTSSSSTTTTPPPPPPMMLPSLKQTKPVVGGSLSEILKQVSLTTPSSDSNSNNNNSKKGSLDMTTVLKDLGKVKLKPVERSPGGTPVNKNPKPSATDPASIIAEALKRKFRNHVQHSPDVDKENENHDFDSSDNSPKFKFGQHVLRKTQRRLSLIQETTQLATSPGTCSPVSSPLKILNCLAPDEISKYSGQGQHVLD
ncbi:hypothetical protein C0Q70_16451 [Pomacea canaliculata]|uniref:Uncharacterized protein n=1 Tax=Pomacea canaliculata TaxID=400727 RepID=A0A2T7NPU3_POMCA|nr:hypothetical protein C0Q70_16451 [Pomacea canaliculata]